MKILIICQGDIKLPGGVYKTVREIAKNLALNGHNVIILQDNPLNHQNEEILEGFKIVRIRTQFGSLMYGINPEMYLYLKKHLTEINPDIVHVHGYHTLLSPEIIFAIQKIDAKVPIVFSPHFDIFSHDKFLGKILWKPYNRLIGRKVIKHTTKIIAASDFEATNISSVLGAPTNKIVVIPHGVNIIDLKKNSCNNTKINLLSAGYLLELKGVQHIIKALKELIHKNGIDVLLTIVGKGPYENQLKKLAKELDVDSFIDWKGFLSYENLIDEFKRADVFLLTSKSENYGIVVPEALALGTPVIVTKRTALVEFLNEPGCFGVDYPPDPMKLSELIQDICSKDIEVGPFSSKIRTWDKVAEDYLQLYNIVLEKHGENII